MKKNLSLTPLTLHTGFSVLSRTMSDVLTCNTTRNLYHCPETTTVRRTEVPEGRRGH